MELNTDVQAQVDAAQALYDYFNDATVRSATLRRLLKDLGLSLAKVKGEDFDANRRW